MDATTAPQPPQGGAGTSGSGGKGSQNGGTGNSTASAKLRKRTKTGCLTCRKRRIKCGEERPICNNCTKSKRTCEGYNQRLNWKPPLADFGGFGDEGQALPYHTGTFAQHGMEHYRPVPPPINTGTYMPIRIQSGHPYAMAENGESIFSPPHTAVPFMQQNMHGLPMTSPPTPYPPSYTPMTPQYPPPMYGQGPLSAISPQPYPPNYTGGFQPPAQGVPPGHILNGDAPVQQFRQPSHPVEDFMPPVSSGNEQLNSIFQDHQVVHAPPQSEPVGPVCWWEEGDGSAPQQASTAQTAWIPTTAANGEAVSPNFSGPGPTISPTVSAPQAARYLGPSLTGAVGQFLEDAAVENHDDNYYDVESDDDMDGPPNEAFSQLNLMRQLHQEHYTELSMRRYDTFLYNNMLDHYRPEEHANPLNNPNTARVFAHFIFATGPSLSIFERHSRNPSAFFNETPSDHSQGIWTYTLPMKAMYNKGLLHAMLALSSLHISKLQGTSNQPSYKHYGYAIKDIHKRVGNKSKKLRPTTIAATLLLGFYEILTADHLKWSSHLAGAKQLLQAIPFKRMAKEACRLKAQQLAQKDHFAFYDGGMIPDTDGMSATIDENLLSSLMGREVKVEQFGHVLGDEDDDRPSNDSPSSRLDMANYELYQDLYWWYARQDVYQAILSGNKLLLDYHRWTDCPPRASIGRADAIYGTHDHLIVLFARIADFNAKDRQRKIRVINANGGHWRPAPGMSMGPPPGMGPPGQVPPGQGPPPGYGPPPGQGPPLGMPAHVGNPNTPYMQSGVGPSSAIPQLSPQAQDGLPQNPMMGYGHPPSPNVNLGQSPLPSELNGFTMGNGQAGAPFRAGGLPTQSPMGASPNFKQEHGFSDASRNPPYSGQSPMGPPPGMGDMRRGSLGGPPPPPPPPTFYGMAPLPTTVNMPSSYAAYGSNATPSPKSEKGEIDPDVANANALKEWGQLKIALNTFESHLGPHFQPMPADVHPATQTPFGPALFYRSHDVASIWAIYYMACIILERAHPHMPPAAMMAAGVAARQTSPFASRIGQIVGGIAPPIMGPDLSPNLGACLCECSLPLFFAGVQYQDPTQREWLVGFLRNVELRTGWKSIGMVAQGCETAWEKAFEMKRGPPYKRKFDQWHIDTLYDSRVARITNNYTALDNDHPELASRMPRDHQGTRVHWAMGILSVVEDGDEKESRHVSGVQPSKEPLND